MNGHLLCGGAGRSAASRAVAGLRSSVMHTRIALVVALVASAAGLPIAGSAQVKPGATAADVALYAGADRLQKLVDGAKKEGTVSIYTSAQTTDFNLLSAAFEKKYGVKVTIWRGGSEDIVTRTVQEN